LLAAMGQEKTLTAVFNICTGRTTTLLELAASIGRVFGREPAIAFAEGRVGDIRASLGDPEAARDVLGFEANILLEDGLRRMLAVTP
jgi:UDP-glucose 4-epimerase